MKIAKCMIINGNFSGAIRHRGAITFGKNAPKAIYAINRLGEYKRYDKIKDAADDLNTTTASILWNRDKKSYLSGEYIIINAEDIEKQTPDGTCIPDETKLEEIKGLYSEKKKKIPLYSIDSKGVYRRFSGIKEASEEYDIKPEHLRNYLRYHTVMNGILYIRADEVETEDNNGEIILDEKKLSEINKKVRSTENKKNIPIYVINKAGKFHRYISIKEAQRATGVSEYELKKCLNREVSAVGNLSFIYASEAEEKDENGNYIPKKSVLKDLYKSAFGEYKKSSI